MTCALVNWHSKGESRLSRKIMWCIFQKTISTLNGRLQKTLLNLRPNWSQLVPTGPNWSLRNFYPFLFPLPMGCKKSPAKERKVILACHGALAILLTRLQYVGEEPEKKGSIRLFPASEILELMVENPGFSLSPKKRLHSFYLIEFEITTNKAGK